MAEFGVPTPIPEPSSHPAQGRLPIQEGKINVPKVIQRIRERTGLESRRVQAEVPRSATGLPSHFQERLTQIIEGKRPPSRKLAK